MSTDSPALPTVGTPTPDALPTVEVTLPAGWFVPDERLLEHIRYLATFDEGGATTPVLVAKYAAGLERALAALQSRAETAERERDEYLKLAQGLVDRHNGTAALSPDGRDPENG